MTGGNNNSPVLGLFVFETNQLLEQLERIILDGEKAGGLAAAINEVFRVMHTIKGSAAMMLLDNIAELAHALEDVFYYLREEQPGEVDYSSLADMVLSAADFIRNEIAKLENGDNPNGDPAEMIGSIRCFLQALKGCGSDQPCAAAPSVHAVQYYIGAKKPEKAGVNTYEACIFFDEDCGMENVRAFMLVHELKEFAEDIRYLPPDVLDNDDNAEAIRREGFRLYFSSRNTLEEIREFLDRTMFLKSFEIQPAGAGQPPAAKKRTIDLEGPVPEASAPAAAQGTDGTQAVGKQNFISVNVGKMDLLMDLVGELVIAEAMVSQNPELRGLPLDGFYKAARQLRKITDELQDVVMSIRMVPLAATFHKTSRIVRDMNKKLNKQAELEIVGGETEVDKNIIEHLSDPLMHLIRNAVDHGIESPGEREQAGKPPAGKLRLEAKNAGGEVWIMVQDDGRGLDREKILAKAVERGLTQGIDNSLTDKEVYSFILHPGFSTKETVTEFSGRGVGMDVVAQNIEKIGGSIHIDSSLGCQTTITIRIPLTLAIIDGMNIRVGRNIYTIPINSIRESFRISGHRTFRDTGGAEMIMLRGECYPILRLYERYRIQAAAEDLPDGIMVMIEADDKKICLFADALLGQQQVVVKALPKYLKKTQGIAGCTLLGDGSVSLILDVSGLVGGMGSGCCS